VSFEGNPVRLESSGGLTTSGNQGSLTNQGVSFETDPFRVDTLGALTSSATTGNKESLTSKGVLFEADQVRVKSSDGLTSRPTTGDQEPLTSQVELFEADPGVATTSGNKESSMTQDVLFDADPVRVGSSGNQESFTRQGVLVEDAVPLWRLICDSCWLSFQFVRSQSSRRHLRFLAAILDSNPTDQLLAELVSRDHLRPITEVSGRRDFLEGMILPLVDKFGDEEGCHDISAMLTTIYLQLEAREQVHVAREITARAARNLICANFLCGIVSSKDLSGEVRCWLRGEEFGSFIAELTDDVCRRRLTMRKTADDEDISMVTEKSVATDQSMVTERSMDDCHWKLLCACLPVDQNSGLLSLICSNGLVRLNNASG